MLKQIALNENSKLDTLDTTYWCKNSNFSGAKKMLHYIKVNERRIETDNQDFER